jgi:cytochrome P450
MALPPGLPLPTAAQTLLWARRPIELLEWCQKRYGDMFTMRLPLGTIVLVSKPEWIRKIFTGDSEELRAGEVNAVIGPVVGANSVLTLDGAQHLRHRKMMLPPFHGERMRVYASTMQQITARAVDGWREHESFRLHTHAQSITLDVILRTVFGIDEVDQLEELRDELKRLLDLGGSPVSTLLFIQGLQKDLGFLTPYHRFVTHLRRSNDLIYRQIARRRAQALAGGPKRNDVLALMLEARDDQGRPLRDVELRDELVTLLLAGHETTASALCWAFERVLATPRVQARLCEELRAVIGTGPLSPEHLPRLEYLEATIIEALRLRPILPMVGRKLRAPFALGSFELPAGVVVAPSIYLTHRRPDIYPEPDEFRPERFIGVRPDPYAWLPFGGGIRRCLGMAFALYEMKVVMATILSRVELELAQPAPARVVRRSITFTPQHGTLVRVRRLLDEAGVRAASAA